MNFELGQQYTRGSDLTRAASLCAIATGMLQNAPTRELAFPITSQPGLPGGESAPLYPDQGLNMMEISARAGIDSALLPTASAAGSRQSGTERSLSPDGHDQRNRKYGGVTEVLCQEHGAQRRRRDEVELNSRAFCAKVVAEQLPEAQLRKENADWKRP